MRVTQESSSNSRKIMQYLCSRVVMRHEGDMSVIRNRNLWRTTKPTTTVIPQGKTSSTKRSSGPRAGVKQEKTRSDGSSGRNSSQTRMSLVIIREATPGQTPKVDRKKQDPSLKRRSTAPKEDTGKEGRPWHTPRHQLGESDSTPDTLLG